MAANEVSHGVRLVRVPEDRDGQRLDNFLLLQFKGDYIGPREMRKHATWYTKGLPHGAELRNLFNQAETREDFIRIVDKFLLKG